MSLEIYKKKRSFIVTPEPKGKGTESGPHHGEQVARDDKRIFVVQKHDASHLHYDFRLEAEGILRSWAVPKGPSMDPADKRLAIQVEDHPMEYAKFHGRIPKGNYGAGKVEIWDKGTYETKFADDDMWEFNLKGKRLKGMFTLIRIKNRNPKYGKKNNKNNWLLIKKKDRDEN
ncbi:MAG: 3'-phosphoesterase [Candidatus Collierbacteria bacterium GW2011_GWB1_44_6]|uniref:3'-phosphoesterase n=2 Tax=Candidatus Collieribacteriota TaxID=1752725 RepID=A0A0G1LUH8_9BACT|nr:MAG: 3'-phosphoesterase [Candidatus Collierbacteria bacterium GW2011_GWC2_43_12]KKT72477.1 MAG: 3'-phosphoesterase [Candidatus Collierbacteria bacterium GW2011_GWB1_44_6]KKT81223.1 MAG: 3'-phosphoesterase [Microgenomates group bacterium GW2011_GWC1_44_9]